MFAVVRFLSDSSVDVVPSNWLNGNECLWPSKFRASRAIKAVKLRESPDLTYTRHSIVILSKEDTFQKARSKLRKAEDTDNVATSTDQVALRQRRVVIIQLQAALCARPHQALQRKVVTVAITLYTHWMSLTMRKESEEPHHHLSGIKVKEVITKLQATSWSHPHQALQISHVLY
ncbi:uncharacterized protein LOC121836205 [Ixodes scapularis]|uniref:uncharacterized protein LOC121836205 n=1 Tax=Ixodes scapularis TaxID=6945 RepID=UPI001C38DB19|nr:uncharacterized protein LOC121836205 [Ixodes scapularis]XP_042146999.1 uncharacterized protein LOC121836205 [Ixodes scapularis]